MSKSLDIRAGDRFETVYPFIFVRTDHQQWDGNVFTDERWIGGCRKTFEPAATLLTLMGKRGKAGRPIR